MLERAVELGKANLSEDDPDVLRTAYQLGAVLQQADDPTAARRVLEEAYAAGLWRLGDSDALMLEISHDIGVVAEELGNRHEARKAFARVAELGPATLGGGHWAVARARAYLGQDPQADVRGLDAEQTQPAPSLPVDPHVAPWQPRFSSSNPEPAPTEEPTTALHLNPENPEPPPFQAANDPTTTFPAINPNVPAPRRPHPADDRDATGDTGAGGETRAGSDPDANRGAGTGANAANAGTLQPSDGENRQVWTGRDLQPLHPVEEATALHSTITPRSDPPAPVPQQRYDLQPAIIYPDSPGPGWGHNGPTPAYILDPASAPPSYQKRGLGIFAAIAAVLAAVIAVAALVFVLANRSSDDGDNPDVPTLGGSPPTAVVLKDSGARIVVSWKDPTQGSVSFLVAMGHPGEQLKPVTTLGPGQTSYEISSLNPTLNYCFAVVAVYRNNQFATSQQACTNR
ncbi:hypothetical protein BJ973_003979 [Actinoplanes tereljensis]